MNSPCRIAFSTLLLLASWTAHPSRADVAITAQEVGKDVVFAYSGAINVDGLGDVSSDNARGMVYPAHAWVEFGPGTGVDNATNQYEITLDGAEPVIGPNTVAPSFASSYAGSYFGIKFNAIKLPKDYKSDSPISGTMTFAGKTLAGMGVNVPSTPYVWTLNDGQKVTLTFLAKQAGPDNAKKIKDLQKKARSLKKKIRIAKKNKKAAQLKKLKKQLKRTNARIRKLK